MKEIAFYIRSLNGGGAENYLVRFLKKFQNQADFIVISTGSFNDDLGPKFKELSNVRFIFIKFSYGNLYDIFQLYKLLKSNKIYSFTSFSSESSFFVMLPAYLAKVKNRIVFYRHETLPVNVSFLKRLYYKLSVKLIPLVSTKVLSNSYSGLTNYYPNSSKKYPEKFSVIENGISYEELIIDKLDIKYELGIPEDAYVVGNIARYSPVKNHEGMIKVAESMINKNPNLYFVFCGKAVDVEVPKLIKNSRNKNRIKCLGFNNKVYRVLNTLDLFLFMSFVEGQPNALLEAMAKGIPFVASNINSVNQAVPDNYKDYLVDPLDINKIEQRMNKIIQNNQIVKPVEDLRNQVLLKYNSNEKFKEFFEVITQ